MFSAPREPPPKPTGFECWGDRDETAEHFFPQKKSGGVTNCKFWVGIVIRWGTLESFKKRGIFSLLRWFVLRLISERMLKMGREIAEQLIKRIESLDELACQSVEILWGHSNPERAKLFFHYPTCSTEREVQMLIEIDPSQESPIRFHEQIVFHGGYFTAKELRDPVKDYDLLVAFTSKANCAYRAEQRRSRESAPQ